MLYRLGRWLFRVFFRVWLRWEVSGSENVPPVGPLILAANHSSLLDPPLVGGAVRRPVRFMAKDELFRPPLFGRVLRAMGAFPVRRGRPDRQAIKLALRILESGGVVGMFPEGTRGDGRVLLDPQGGAAMLALKSGAALVPMAIKGSGAVMPKGARLPRRVKVSVVVGRPFRVGNARGLLDKEVQDATSRRIMQEIGRLLQEDMPHE